VVHVGVGGMGRLLVRVLTPLVHPAITTCGLVALLDGPSPPAPSSSLSSQSARADTGKRFVDGHRLDGRTPGEVAGLLRALRAQLLVTSVGPEREAVLANEARDWESGSVSAWQQPQPEREARVMTALCAMTEHDRSITSAWLTHFIPHCPQVRQSPVNVLVRACAAL
jgi:hypothetical protein